MRRGRANLVPLASAALATVLVPTATAQAQGAMTVYCSILKEQCREGVAMFERATGTKVAMVRKSTGESHSQIKAEAANPRADVWWGGPAELHLQAGEEGLLEPYSSPALATLHGWAGRLADHSQGRSSGIYLGALGIGLNTEVQQRKRAASERSKLLAKWTREVQAGSL